MIRRLSVTLVAVALTGTIASGCSTFSKNGEAAKVDGTALTIGEFESISADLAAAGQITAPANGEYTGTESRSVLSRWIVAHLLSAALAKSGTPINADSRSTAETSLKTSATDAVWAKLDPATQSFLVNELAGQNMLVSSDFIPAGKVETTYNAGIRESNTLCLRVIGFPTSDAANAAYQQILGGGDFASIADANNTDGTLGHGGIFSDSNTKSECVSARSLNQAVGAALASTQIGVPAAPQAFTASDGKTQQFFIFMQRPFSEVVDAATPLVRQALGPAAERTLVADGKANVDSRYGMWDAATLSVQPTR